MPQQQVDTETRADCVAQRTVHDILDTLEDLRIFCGMEYEAETNQINGSRMLYVHVWETSNPDNTHQAPGNDAWHDQLIQPIVSASARVIDGEKIQAHGRVRFDDNNQNGLAVLFGHLTALLIERKPADPTDDLCPF